MEHRESARHDHRAGWHSDPAVRRRCSVSHSFRLSPGFLSRTTTPAGEPGDAPLSCSRRGERRIRDGRPGVFSSGETRSSSGALSSPGGPGWPPGPLSHSSRRIFDHTRVLSGTGLGRLHPCLPSRSRIGPRRRRQQRGDDHRLRHLNQMHAERRPPFCQNVLVVRDGSTRVRTATKIEMAEWSHPTGAARRSQASVLFVGTVGAAERAPSPKTLRVDAMIKQVIMILEYELRFSLTSLRPALAVPGDRDGRDRAVRGAGLSSRGSRAAVSRNQPNW